MAAEPSRSPATYRVAIVTGANQGIGFEITRAVALHALRQATGVHTKVHLACRNKERATEALANLEKEFSSEDEERARVSFHFLPLDLADPASIAAAASKIKTDTETDGRLDRMMNNAGYAHKPASDFGVCVVDPSTKVNFEGLVSVFENFLPLLSSTSDRFYARGTEADRPRMVNVSSFLGCLGGFRGLGPQTNGRSKGDEIREQFMRAADGEAATPKTAAEKEEPTFRFPEGEKSFDAGVAHLRVLLARFRKVVSSGEARAEHESLDGATFEQQVHSYTKSEGWRTNCYGVAKSAVTAVTLLAARRHPEVGGPAGGDAPKVFLAACCPGSVRTYMSGGNGLLSPAEGQDTPSFLLLDEKAMPGLHGEFVRHRVKKDWTSEKLGLGVVGGFLHEFLGWKVQGLFGAKANSR